MMARILVQLNPIESVNTSINRNAHIPYSVPLPLKIILQSTRLAWCTSWDQLFWFENRQQKSHSVKARFYLKLYWHFLLLQIEVKRLGAVIHWLKMAMLAEPRRKQRIGPNPRGKFFLEEEDNPGKLMLQKMGWRSGDGLGIQKQGMNEPLRPKTQMTGNGK